MAEFILSAEKLKVVVTSFYFWWHNQPGSNTFQGFEDWMQGDEAKRLLYAAPAPEQQVEQEPVAYALFRDGEVCYEADDGVVISNTPGDETELYTWRALYTTPPAAPDVSGLVEALERIAAGERLVERGGRSEVENDMTIDYPGIAKEAISAHWEKRP